MKHTFSIERVGHVEQPGTCTTETISIGLAYGGSSQEMQVGLQTRLHLKLRGIGRTRKGYS